MGDSINVINKKLRGKGIWPALLFILLLAILTISSDAPRIIFLRPQSVHQWRQCDCTSQTLNFYQNRVSFLTPQQHNLKGKNGYEASEFPIIYFMVAQLYSLFGFHEFLFRGFDLLIFYTALFFLFLTCCDFFKNFYLALIPPLLLGTAPYVYYYANNFLPNVPAISFSLIGWYCFFRYIKNTKFLCLALSFFLFTLSALLKASDGISLAVASGVLAAGYLSWFGLKGSCWKKHLPQKIILVTLAFAILILWVKYTIAFNKEMGNQGSLIGILPIWNMPKSEIERVRSNFSNIFMRQLFSIAVWLLTGILTLAFPFFWKKYNHLLRLITVAMLIGSACYCILWFQAFDVHDYYMLTPIMYFVFLIITNTELLANKITPWPAQRIVILYVILSVCSVYLFNYNRKIQITRYASAQYPVINPGFFTITPYLRSLGIDRHDKVVSVPDPSGNITLYLMNNPGWTEAFNWDAYNINYFAGHGAKYLIIGDSSYLHNPLYQPYIYNKIGEKDGIYIFKLKPSGNQ